jgi:4-amino-4-deoxy-L-arabinose transferase-like glycosyltransferase
MFPKHAAAARLPQIKMDSCCRCPSLQGHAYLNVSTTADGLHMPATDSTGLSRWHWPIALLTITLFALALRWYYVSMAMVDHPIRGDTMQYYAYALNLAHHGIFSMSLPDATSIIPDSYRDPGYPLFLALWMKGFGSAAVWYGAVLRCQALLGALTVAAATQLGKYWLSSRWAICAGMLMAVWPHSITVNDILLTETLFGFLCALAALLCAHACARKSGLWAITAGLVFGAAALTNAVLQPFAILLALLLAWRGLAPRKICVGLALGALLLPAAWAIRNAQIPATVGNSSRDRALQNLVQGTWPNFNPAWRASIFGSAREKIDAHIAMQPINDEYSILRASTADGVAAILQRFEKHPLQYISWYLVEKPSDLWGWSIMFGQGDIYINPTVNSPFQEQPAWSALEAFCHGLNRVLMLLALTSLIVMRPAAQRRLLIRRQLGNSASLMTAFLLVFVTLVYSIFQAEPRYSIPFRSFEILLAVTCLCGATAWWREHRRSSNRHVSIPESTAIDD